MCPLPPPPSLCPSLPPKHSDYFTQTLPFHLAPPSPSPLTRCKLQYLPVKDYIVCQFIFRMYPGGFLTNCSNAGLTSIPDNIPHITTHLLLSDNNLSIIKNKYFINLSKLKTLDPTNSHIYRLEGFPEYGKTNNSSIER